MNFDPLIRRLPVYMLIDCSSSMNGDAIESVYHGFKNLMAKLMNDPYTCDIVWLSIITFDSIPRQLIPMCPIHHFKGLPISICGSSNLGRALLFLSQRIKEEVRKQTKDQRGDWKPLVFLMSDGEPTDQWTDIADKVKSEINLVACGVGSDVNIDNLKRLSDLAVHLKDMTQETFNQFIDFLSNTLSTASQRSDGKSDKLILEQKYDKIILS